jgi:hypothetical protein
MVMPLSSQIPVSSYQFQPELSMREATDILEGWHANDFGRISRQDFKSVNKGVPLLKKWTRWIGILVPAVATGSVYAYASGGLNSSPEEKAAQIAAPSAASVQSGTSAQDKNSADSSGVTISIQEVKPAPDTASDTGLAQTSAIPNPFVVANNNSSSSAVQETSISPTHSDSGGTQKNPAFFSLDNVRSLHLDCHTTGGELKLNYEEGDTAKLAGSLGSRKIEMTGSAAKQWMEQLIQQLGLADGLEKAFSQPETPISRGTLAAVSDLRIVMNNGQTVTFDKTKVEGEHGLHKGQEKGKEHPDHGKHKGKGKEDD